MAETPLWRLDDPGERRGSRTRSGVSRTRPPLSTFDPEYDAVGVITTINRNDHVDRAGQ